MTPWTFLLRHEWLPPDVNDSPEFLTPSVQESLSACYLFHCWLVECNHESCVHYYSPTRSDIFYRGLNAIAIPAMDHRTVNWNLFARLSTTIHQYPSSTTLECSDANASGILALSLKNDADTGESLRRKCSESHSRRGVIHASDTVLLTTVWYDNSLC